MGEGWWMASDGKWYSPELHPDFQDAPTTESDSVASRGPTETQPTPHASGPPTVYPWYPGYKGDAGSAGQGPATADPSPAGSVPGRPTDPSRSNPPTLINPVYPTDPATPGPAGDSSKRGKGPLIGLVVIMLAIGAALGGCVALVLTSRSDTTDNASATTDREADAATTSAPKAPETTSELPPPEPSTTTTTEPAPTTTTTTTTTSLVPPPPAPESTSATMPNVVCMDLQSAQDAIQAAGVFFSRSFDATGAGRSQIVDRNWIVVSQDPQPGASIEEGQPNLGAVKMNEPAPC